MQTMDRFEYEHPECLQAPMASAILRDGTDNRTRHDWAKAQTRGGRPQGVVQVPFVLNKKGSNG